MSHSYIPKEKSFCPKARLFECNVSSTTSSIATQSFTKLDRSILHFFFLFQILQLQMNDYRYHYMFTTFVSTSSNYFQQSFETIKKKNSTKSFGLFRTNRRIFIKIVRFISNVSWTTSSWMLVREFALKQNGTFCFSDCKFTYVNLEKFTRSIDLICYVFLSIYNSSNYILTQNLIQRRATANETYYIDVIEVFKVKNYTMT